MKTNDVLKIQTNNILDPERLAPKIIKIPLSK
jgi:hypothetical protein